MMSLNGSYGLCSVGDVALIWMVLFKTKYDYWIILRLGINYLGIELSFPHV